MGVAGPAGRRAEAAEPLVDSVLGEGVVTDEIHLVGPRMLVVNKTPAVWSGRVGLVITLRDHTDLQAISGELDRPRVSPTRCVRRTTRLPTGCTRSCR